MKLRYILSSIGMAWMLCGCGSFLEEYSQDKDYITSWKNLDELLMGDCYLPVNYIKQYKFFSNPGMFLHLLADEMEEESDLIEVHQQQSQFGYEFTISQPLSLPSSTKATATEIARYKLPATYLYKTYPKKDKEAFLVAEATDWQKLNLLEGDANVFFDNSYVGKSRLSTLSDTDTLYFSLGRDPNIRVERTKVNEKSTRRFLGSSQEQTVTWNIKVTNTRREAVKLNVYDQTPIARNSDINVTIEELSGGQLNKDTGIVTWTLDMKPGEKRELLLQYKVKYPKNERLNVE